MSPVEAKAPVVAESSAIKEAKETMMIRAV
jgi:hypothetical protein